MEKVFELYIKTSAERLWQAITDRELRAQYNFGVNVYSDWQQGSTYKGLVGTPDDGMLLFEGEVLEAVRPTRLVLTYRACWSDAVKREGTSRVTWAIEPVASSCKLVLVHDELRADAHPQLYGGWPMVLSGLKTLLETGEFLTTPASLQFLGR